MEGTHVCVPRMRWAREPAGAALSLLRRAGGLCAVRHVLPHERPGGTALLRVRAPGGARAGRGGRYAEASAETIGAVALGESLRGPLPALMAGEFAVHQPEGDVYSTDECKAWLAETAWKLVESRPLAGPQSVVIGEAV